MFRKKEIMSEKPKKEDRRVRRTKKLLVQALTELLQDKQINEITVKELTELADINRGTFYLYYRDIYDMLEKVEDEMFREFDDITSLHEHEDVKHHMKPILLDFLRFIEENQAMCRVLLSPNGDMKFLQRLHDVILEKSRHIFIGKDGLVNEENFEYRCNFVVFGCAGLIRLWVNRHCKESAVHMAELADAMIRQGILAETIH